MRILLATHRLPPDGVTAVARSASALASELAANGDTVHIIARRPCVTPYVPQLERERLPSGMMVYRLVGGGSGWTDCLTHQDRLEQLFKAVLLETAAEIVHFNHIAHFSPRSPELARRLGVPVVLSVNDFFYACPLGTLQKLSGERCAGPRAGAECASTCFEGEGAPGRRRWGVRTLYFKRLLQSADAVLCPSRFMAEHAAQAGADRARLRIIPPALRMNGLPNKPPLFKQAASLNLAFLGPVVHHTGLHVLLEALSMTRMPLNLFVSGPLPNVDYATRVCEQARRIARLNVRWRGPAYAAGTLAEIDCVICPSLFPERAGRSALRALAHGVPLLVSRLGALPEWVSEGENGFTFPVNQPGVLAQLLRRLATDPGLVEHLRAGAAQARPLTPLHHAQAMRELYRSTIAGAGTASRCDGDRSEIDFLHEAMINLGFGRSA